MNISDFCFNINKLKITQLSLEKNEADFIKFIKDNCDRNIEEEYMRQKLLREQEDNKLKREVYDNIMILKNIKYMLSDSNLEKIDMEFLKTNMLRLQSNIQTLQCNIKTDLDFLLKKEHTLNSELTSIETKLSDMNKHTAEFTKISTCPIKNIAVDQHLYQEVKDFTTFLSKTGGHEGGWNEEDHLLFIKTYNKTKCKLKVVPLLLTLLSDMSEEQILAHIKWYETYLELRAKQKEAIEKWRQNKTETEVNSKDQNINSCSKIKFNKDRTNEFKEQKEKIQQWKLEKQQKVQNNLNFQARLSTKTKKIEKQKKQHQLQMKIEVEKWKSLKSATEKAEKLEKDIQALKEKERKISQANKLIREFQKQDTVYIIQRLSTLKKSLSNISDVAKPPPVRELRNPDRLFKPTRQWLARISSEESQDSAFQGQIQLRQIPKLAVPEWRKTAAHV